MVPDKFNMVDMEGIDILFSYGDVIPGLYHKLVESITQCRYQCLYNWYFDSVLIPPSYVEMSVNQDTNDVWINGGVFVTSDDRMMVHLPSIETVSGAIVNITDALPRKVEELICYINPLQAGSGVPSPDNIRPISGFSAINVYNEETYEISATPKLTVNWQTEAGTIYGGSFTLNEDGSCDIAATIVGIVLNGTQPISLVNWKPTTNSVGWLYPYTLTNNVIGTGTVLQNIKCDRLTTVAYNSMATLDGQGIALANNTPYGIAVKVEDTTLTTVAAINAYLAQNPIQVVYELATPQTYHFDNIGQFYTRLGTNVIWHDANGDISVTYWKE